MAAGMTVLGAVLMVTGVGFGIAATVQFMELHVEVNDRLPEGQKFEPIGWTFLRHMRFRELQRSVLPESPRPARYWRLAITGWTFFFSGVGLVLLMWRR